MYVVFCFQPQHQKRWPKPLIWGPNWKKLVAVDPRIVVTLMVPIVMQILAFACANLITQWQIQIIATKVGTGLKSSHTSYVFLFSSWELCVIILWELVSGIYPGAKLANCLEKSELLWSSLEYITTELDQDNILQAQNGVSHYWPIDWLSLQATEYCQNIY